MQCDREGAMYIQDARNTHLYCTVVIGWDRMLAHQLPVPNGLWDGMDATRFHATLL